MRDSTLFKHLTSSAIVTGCCVLGLLYFGRDVLEPLALAVILSLVIAPLIRSLRRLGFGQMPATMLSVLMVGTCVVGLGIVLAFQLVAVTGDLPKYRAAIRTKVAAVKAGAGAGVAGRPHLVHPDQQGIAVAVQGHRLHELHVPGSITLAPVFLPRA